MNSATGDPNISLYRRVSPELMFKELSFAIDDGTLRVIEFSKPGATENEPILFIPGWASTPLTWRRFIPRLCDLGPIHYLETREKSSSDLSGRAPLSVKAVSADVAAYANRNLSTRSYGVIAASTGVNTYIEACEELVARPRWLVLLLPHVEIPIPWTVLMIRIVPAALLPYLKPLATRFLRTFRLTHREDEQQRGIFAALESADLRKLRDSGIEWRRYRLDLRKLADIANPTMVVGASRDRFHPFDVAEQISSSLGSSHLVDQVSFDGSHSSRSASGIVRWVKGLEHEPGREMA